jgi:hypothetical protein
MEQTFSHHGGSIDEVKRDLLFGWACDEGESRPVSLTVSYDGVVTGKILANLYRSDLERAGIGTGYHGFETPLPCDPKIFRTDLLEICFPDGTPLPRSDALIAPAFFADDLDLLASPRTRIFQLELTSRCNLRCVYCAVSQPTYYGEDMEVEDFAALVAMLKARRIQNLYVNGHGETTFVPGWHHQIMALAAEGFHLSIITNFARLLSSEELTAMAHVADIHVSVDTHRAEVLRRIRRRVDLGNILINMASVSARAETLGLPKPEFGWNCVVTDQVVDDLVEYVRFGLSCRVHNFHLCNLEKHDDIEGAENVQHVATLPDDALVRFLESVEQIKALVLRAGGSFSVQSGLMDSVHERLKVRGTG